MSVTDTPDPIRQGYALTLAAFGVGDPDGTDYLGINPNGQIDVGTDEYLGQYLVRGQENDGDWIETNATSGRVNPSAAIVGDKVSIAAFEWSDDTSGGDNDGVIETAEDVRLRVKLRSSVALGYIFGTLSSPIGELQISDAQLQYPPVPAGGEVWPYGDFDMFLDLASTTNVPLNLYVEYSYSGQDYYQYLPSFSATFYHNGSLAAGFDVVSYLIDDSTTVASFNNGDGRIQSGEAIRIQPKLKNTGQAGATDIDAWLTYNGTAFSVDGLSNVDGYPDLAPGQEEYSGSTFAIRDIRRDYSGLQAIDFHLTYDQNPDEVVLPGEIQVNIEPAAWLRLSEESFDFGVAEPGTTASHTILVQNVGSAPLQVTAVTTSHADTTWSGFPLGCTIGAGQSTNLTISINTTNLQGQISRQIQVSSTGRLRWPGEDDSFTIGGLVSSTVPVFQVPGVTGGSEPDISGDWLVWCDGRNGNSDIYAYNISTGVEKAICTNSASQWRPYISGNLIVWEDMRNYPSAENADIYAYDLSRPDLGDFPCLLTSGNADLIGLDGTLVALSTVYYTFTEDCSQDSVHNLIVREYIGNGQFSQKFHSGFSSNMSHNPMQDIDEEGDFGGGLLVVERCELWWDTQYSSWERRNSRYQTINFASDGTTLVDAGGTHYLPCATRDRFVYQDDDANRDQQIYLRRVDGTVQQLTTTPDLDYAQDVLGIGGPDGSDCIAYDYRDLSRRGLYYLDRSNNQEYIISTTANPEGLRMDGLHLVFRDYASDSIKYVFLKQPDVQVAAAGITFSDENPIEGVGINVSVLVRNLSAYNQAGQITVGLYDGDPDAGGFSIATPQTFTGLAAHTDQTIVFSNVILVEAMHQIFAKLTVTTSDPGINNKASRAITVRDSDTVGPVIGAFTATERGGDGDGVIGDDEAIRISWTLADASGIGAVTVTVDGVTNTVQGTYYADVGPLAAGEHIVTIWARDGDLSAETREASFDFTVVDREFISVTVNGRAVPDGAAEPINLGTFWQGRPAAEAMCVIGNAGEQTLNLGTLSVSPVFNYTDPSTNAVPPGGFSLVGLTPHTGAAGMFTGSVSLASSDLARSPFDFSVCYEVIADIAAPTVSITAPVDGTTFRTSAITVDGTSADASPSSGIRLVHVRVNEGSWEPAAGTGPWSLGITLAEGPNTIEARAEDNYGNVGGSAVVHVTYVPPENLSHQPEVLANSTPWGQAPTNQIVQIWNSGGGTMAYSLNDDAGWLSLSPTNGTSGGESDPIIVSYNTSGLSSHVYTATITITATGAVNSPQTVPVTLTIVPPQGPSGVGASDGQFTNVVRITWDKAAWASHYQVYRSSTPDDYGTSVSLWLTTNLFDYPETSPGISAYYRVRAATSSSGANPSEYSAADEGWRGLARPAVTATDGSYTNRVAVSWSAVAGASHYQLYRSVTNAANLTAVGGWTAATAVDDFDALPGVTNYYWARAAMDASGGRASDLGVSNMGWRALSAPTGVSATQGISSNGVGVNWQQVEGAGGYRVSRASTTNGTPTDLGTWLSGTSYFDTNAVIGATNYYYVRAAVDLAGVWPSTSSAPAAAGWWSLAQPGPVVASDGAFTNKVTVGWPKLAGGTHYQVYTGAVAGGSVGAASAWITTNIYDHTAGPAGVSLYYSVRAATSIAGANASAYSGQDEGWKALVGPKVTATDGIHTNRVAITWTNIAGASYYRIHRTVAGSGQTNEMTGWINGTTNWDDFTVTPGLTNYYFAMAAIDDSGNRASTLGAGDMGWRALAAPTGLAASKGAFTNLVEITWAPVEGAGAYRVSRSTTTNGTKTALGTWTNAMTYADASTAPGVTNYYFVQAAANNAGVWPSAYSAPDFGWRCKPKVIALNPTNITMVCTQGQDVASRQFDIWNAGEGEMYYSLRPSEAWLSLDPTNGVSSGEHDQITVDFDTTILNTGTHTASITVTAPGATNSGRALPVRLSILPPLPVIGVAPTNLAPSCPIGTNPTNDILRIQNIGGRTLTYTLSENVPWLSIAPLTGTSTGEVDQVVVTYAATNLAMGTSNTTILISAAGATNTPVAVPVALTVRAYSRIIRLAGSLDFGTVAAGSNPVTNLTVHNDGLDPLTISGITNAPWFVGNCSTQLISGGSVSVPIAFVATNAGHYSGVLKVLSDATSGTDTMPESGTIAGLDADFDGMPDDWEIEHFGSTTALPGDDHDRDGFTNIQEQWAGTNPTSRSSKPCIGSIRPEGQNMAIRFESVAGRQYWIEWSDDMITWNPLVQTNGTGAPIQINDVDACRDIVRRFYRIVIAPE